MFLQKTVLSWSHDTSKLESLEFGAMDWHEVTFHTVRKCKEELGAAGRGMAAVDISFNSQNGKAS